MDEIDDILNSIKGDWNVDKYIGFVDSSIYYPDLFDYNNNLEQNVKDKLINNYKEKVKNAKNNIPKIYFSVKKYNGKANSWLISTETKTFRNRNIGFFV